MHRFERRRARRATRPDPTPATLFRALCRRRPPRPEGAPRSLDALIAELRGLTPTHLAEWLGALGNHPPVAVAARLGTHAAALTLWSDGRQRRLASQALLAGLRWQGSAGVGAARAAFDALDLEGRSLAAVVLGLLGDHAATARLLRLYHRTGSDWRVGPLWGLVDLGAPEAVDLLLAELDHRPRLAEVLPMLARAGDTRAVAPLVADREGLWPALRREHVFALLCICRRVGAARFLEALGEPAGPAAQGRLEALFAGLRGDSPTVAFGPLYAE